MSSGSGGCVKIMFSVLSTLHSDRVLASAAE